MRVLRPQFRLSTLMFLVAVVAAMIWLNASPMSIWGDGVTELMGFSAFYGWPATYLSRNWTGRFDSPPHVPRDAEWHFDPVGLLVNLAFGLLIVLVGRIGWTRVQAHFHEAG